MTINTSYKLLKMKRTKIVATVGPASHSREVLEALIKAGVNIFRLNMSHGEHEQHAEVFHTIRELSEKMDKPTAILADLCGPKIRTGTFEGGSIELERGEDVVVTTRDVTGKPGLIPSRYEALASDVRSGDRILLADGLLELKVNKIEDTEIHCTVLSGGTLGNRKGINLPGVNISAPSMTEKDHIDARFALELGADILALSFVRRASDVEELREIVNESGRNCSIIAKIEKPEALSDIEAIVKASDGIMVARGDLGVELPAEQVPMIQDELVDFARSRNRSVIVATQMLESMIDHTRATRAEVADVSHAVRSGVDAVMLSGETAVGKHPVRAVEVMSRVARQAEGYLWKHQAFGSFATQEDVSTSPNPLRDAIANATALLSRDLRVRAIVVPSSQGSTARIVSASRPAAPVIAVSADIDTCRRLCLSWGITPIHFEEADLYHKDKLARHLAKRLAIASSGQHILLVQGFNADPQLNQPSVTVLQM